MFGYWSVKRINQEGKVDSSVVVGVVVVLAIIGAVGYGVYYFGFVKAEREELQEAKDSATNTLAKTLAQVKTEESQAKTREYLAQIQAADSKGEVASIVNEINSSYEIEKKRKELITQIEKATQGHFYELEELNQSLKKQINSATSLNALTAAETELNDKLNSEWRSIHLSQIGTIYENYVVMVRQDSPLYEIHYAKSEARSFVLNKNWEVLKEAKFRAPNSYMVPIINEFQKTPTLEEGSRVDVYEYDPENKTLIQRVQNAEVLKIIYPKDVISSIAWSYNQDGATHRFSTDVWEEIKASKAGFEEANSEWEDWAKSVIEAARDDANIADYDLQVIYVIDITDDEVAKIVTNVEHQQSKKDIVLVARK